ncbi:MAG: hypothetical protein ISS36_04755 [Candidatus Aenigmarchaeota archaeon]|nr:hypothetical protein [Candidatus Aenigmarchaeota archaeon]
MKIESFLIPDRRVYGRYVRFSLNRIPQENGRVITPEKSDLNDDSENCIFCPDGHLWVPGKKPFTIENEYPASSPFAVVPEEFADIDGVMPSLGFCYITVTRGHRKELWDLNYLETIDTVDELAKIYDALIGKEIVDGVDVRHVSIYMNIGRGGGQTVLHPHFKIEATHHFVAEASLRMERAEKEQNLYSEEIECAEKNETVLYEDGDFVGFVPSWAGFPYEICILPRDSEKHSFSEFSEDDFTSFSKVLYQTMKMGRAIIGEDPLQGNIIFYQLPNCPFSFEFIPMNLGGGKYKRLGATAYTGDYINEYPPGIAAKRIRDAFFKHTPNTNI